MPIIAKYGEIRKRYGNDWVKHPDGWVLYNPITKYCTLEEPKTEKMRRGEQKHIDFYIKNVIQVKLARREKISKKKRGRKKKNHSLEKVKDKADIYQLPVNEEEEIIVFSTIPTQERLNGKIYKVIRTYEHMMRSEKRMVKWFVINDEYGREHHIMDIFCS